MVLEKVKAILSEQFDVEEDSITAETRISEDLGADSLDVVDLLMSLEDEFEVNSVNGWVIQQFGKIPKVGESFEYKNLKIVIQKATKRCVLEIRITVDEPMEISS